MNVGVLASGKGSNLRRLVELERSGRLSARVVALASNRRDCGAVAFAREAGLPVGVFPQRNFPDIEARDLAMRNWLQEFGVELVVLAGYDRVLTGPFTAAFPDRILNVHPSLLPAFGGGMNAVEEALRHGVKLTGCTVHLVDDQVDAGPIVVQVSVPVLEDDTVETLQARIHEAEHRVLPETVELVARGGLRREGRRAVVDWSVWAQAEEALV